MALRREGLIDDTRPPNSLREWLLVIFLAYSFLSHPLFIQYFFPKGGYKIGFLSLLLLNLIVLILNPRIRLPRNGRISDPRITILFVAYGIYLLFLTVATLLHADASTAADLALVYVKVMAACMLFFLLPLEVYRWTLDRYTTLVFLGAVTGIAMVALVSINIISNIGTVGVEGVGETTREFYGIGLGWGQLSIPGGLTVIRLQSFADEPGTFAFMLLLAIIWSFYKRWMWYVGIMIVALLLTWSVGAMMAGAVLLIAYLMKKRSAVPLLVTLIAVIGIFIIYQSSADLIDLVTHYLETKSGDDQGTTSYGERLEYLEKLFQLIAIHPEGVGPGVKAIGFVSPVGWLATLAEAGVLGYFFYFISGLVLIWLSVRSVFLANSEVTILGIMVLVLAFSAMQRARIDYSIWHLWLVVGFLRFYIAHPIQRRFFRPIFQSRLAE
ncbi:MAG: hypothetical protein PHQ60_14235 [Sideroxydans sp.]|nr:hypothetical protein [Sideroxydans sp.]